ncbi:MAG: ComF family protein [Psychromonas sp.]|nr:ComF family protein [Psychromonas sp.]
MSLPKSQVFCGYCLKQPHHFSSIHAIGDYVSPLSSLIKKFKYSKSLLEGELLGILLVRSILFNFSDNKIGAVDYLLPVPLHLDKLRKRGFNQAELIAQVVSKALRIPILYNTAIRNKNTVAQEGLSLYQRKKNLNGAFFIKNNQALKNKHIVIIDDVVTTGATVNSLCKALIEKNVKQLDIWCISRTALKI